MRLCECSLVAGGRVCVSARQRRVAGRQSGVVGAQRCREKGIDSGEQHVMGERGVLLRGTAVIPEKTAHSATRHLPWYLIAVMRQARE